MRALVLRGRVVPPLARGAREGDDLPHCLLRDLRDDAGPHRPPPLPHRKPQPPLPRHRRDPPHRHRHLVPRPHHLHPPPAPPPPPTSPPPRSPRPVTTVPRPVIEKMSSIGIKNGLLIARTGIGM